jgi:hypothetical protein
MNKQILEKIREKREFSQIPEKDIEIAFSHYEKRQASEDEKIRLTKELLRKVFSAFISPKLLSLKDKEPGWILRKHISTRERLPYYKEIYKRIFSEEKIASVIDLGAGINGFSYNFFPKKINYTAIESVGQLVELMNFYFKKEKLSGKSVHLSLFEKEKVKELIKKEKKPQIVFMFKIIDALESLKPNYSKELISELAEISDKIVVSFATRSLGSREKFKVNRNWIVNFIKENFNVSKDFEIGGERYIIFSK